MIVFYIIAFIILLIGIIFIGLNISSSIDNPIIYVFFWLLYVISLFTVGNIISTFVFYDVLRKKRGPPGPRGPPGEKGTRGEAGLCDVTCRNNICYTKILENITEYLNKLKGNPDPPIVIRNSYIKEKMKQMCHSDEFKHVAPMKGPNNLIAYLTEVWKIWIEQIYNAGNQTTTYFETIGAETEWEWVGNNPFDDIKKYDVYYWGLSREYRPSKIETCQHPEENTNLPGPDESRIKLLESNTYKHSWWDKGSGAHRDLKTLRPLKMAQENEIYYPMGYVGISKGAFKVKAEDVEHKTVLVTGDVRGPKDWKWIYNDRGTGANTDVTFWRPIPPRNYTCLGDITHIGRKKPPTGRKAPIRCVPTECVSKISGGFKKLWNDKGSRGTHSGTIFSYHTGTDRTEIDTVPLEKSGYNLMRTIEGYPKTFNDLDLPTKSKYQTSWYKIKPKCYTKVKIPGRHVSEAIDKIGLGWHGSPQREAKYSVFTYLDLVPESIITSKSTDRKYYITHTGKPNPNSYLIRKYDMKTGKHTQCLGVSGSLKIKEYDCNPNDAKLEWKVEFNGNNTTELRMKSAKTNKYLHHEAPPNRRGKYTEKQSNEKDIYTLFGFNRSATGNDFKGDEFKSED